MIRNALRTLVLPIAISLAASGCLVTASRFEEKVAEADSVRDALATASRERNALSARNESLQKQLSDASDAAERCAARAKGQEEELARLSVELSSAKRSYEGTRITREDLITELMEKEKATGKRVQELAARAQSSEAEGERLRKEIDRGARLIAARDGEIAELRAKLETRESEENVRRERDTLLGRLERLAEEHRAEEKRRDARLEAAVGALRESAPGVATAAVGGVLRVTLPEKAVLRPGGDELSDAARAAAAEAAALLSEFPSGRLVVNAAAEGKAMKALMQAVVDAGKVPADRVIAGTRERDPGVELLLIVP